MAHQISDPNSIVDNFFIEEQNHDMFVETCAGDEGIHPILKSTKSIYQFMQIR